MTLHPALEAGIPAEIFRMFRAAFKNNAYQMGRGQLKLYSDCDSRSFSSDQLALITLMQFAEQLTDQQVADAIRSRTGWKYALELKPLDPKFDASILSDFRQRLVTGECESQRLDELLEQFKQQGRMKTRGQAKTDLTSVLETIQLLNRIENIGETLRRALNHLAIAAPEWLLAQASPDWFDRYGTLLERYRIPKKTDLQQLTVTIGQDGQHLLSALDAPHTPEWLRQAPSVKVLRSLWAQQYDFEGKKPI